SHDREVRHLLARAPGWRTPADGRTDGGRPPTVPIARGCLRDGYVASAVQHAWAAESYYRLRHPSAARMAAAAHDDLDRANRLCPRAAPGDSPRCETLGIWGCPAPL
ncbi:MAG TPA: hypothetical protein VHG51_18620, partial [Longimicrobiaceae bacterium]|nr:hypothetical protein [Longimicrobiaceae bacterium]